MNRTLGASLVAGTLVLAPAVAWLEFSGETVDLAAVRQGWRASDARLLDRHRVPVHELRVDRDRRRLDWTDIDDVSPALVDAVVAAEDRRFFHHRGIDWIAVAAAAASVVAPGRVRGASTITMQLAALLDPGLAPRGGERSLLQKLRQMRAARAVERGAGKRAIIEAYLNLVYYRGELQGIAAAARGLFDKAPAGLTRSEAVLLAALIRSPNAAAERVAARACALALRLDGADCAAITAGVDGALAGAPQVRQQVALAPHVARRLLAAGADEVTSTLDAALQRFARDALREALAALRGRAVGDGAVLVVDNAGGEVLAYVGNAGTDPDSFYVDGVRAPRQAGSTLKPFLYGLAFEQRRLTAASLLMDSPVSLQTPTGAYVPQNYDRVFRGWVSARTALAGSVNIPAVRTLMLVGVDAFADRLRHAGFEHITESGEFYGYSLALGSAEVTLWQLVRAYRALAAGGDWGELVLAPGVARPPARRVLDPLAAFIVADILADRGARASTFGLDNAIALPFPAAVKTGTSKDMRDNWCVGFSERYTVGVWVGNFDGAPMRDVSGVAGAAPVWARVMKHLHRDAAPAGLRPPAALQARRVTFDPPVEAPRREWFIAPTAMGRVTAVPAAVRAPRIVYPGDGMILALDADIPPAHQRLFFMADPAAAAFGWRLDGAEVDDPSSGWRLAAGAHRLELVDAGGAVLDDVRFTVRGARPPAYADNAHDD